MAQNNATENNMTNELDTARNERHEQRMVRKKDIVDEKNRFCSDRKRLAAN